MATGIATDEGKGMGSGRPAAQQMQYPSTSEENRIAVLMFDSDVRVPYLSALLLLGVRS